MKKLTAIYVCVLMIALPIYSSIAFADSFDAWASGSDDIAPYFRGDGDTWKFNFVASIDEDEEITPDQITITGIAGSARLDELGGSCTNEATGLSGYTCTFSSTYTPNIDIPIANEFTAKLFDDSGNQKRSKALPLYADLYSPKVTFTAEPVQSGSTLFFEYLVEERAYSETYDGKCTGIDKIEIKSGAKTLETITPTNKELCRYTGTSTLPVSDFTSNTVTVVAYDRFGQKYTKTSSPFILDTGAPEIRSLDITRQDRSTVYLNGQPFLVDIEAVITESGLSASNVFADFSELGAGDRDRADTCSKIGDDYICRWVDRTIEVTEGGEKSITISATDGFGNSGEETLTHSFLVDTSPTTINSLSSSLQYDGVDYVGPSPVNITMILTESGGSGLNESNIRIDLHELGAGNGISVPADYCSQMESLWECVWEDVPSNKEGKLKIDVVYARDNANNIAGGTQTFYFQGDKTQPYLDMVNVKSLSEQENLKGVILAGSNLMITATVIDPSPVTAYADFSRIKNNADLTNVPGDCTQVEVTGLWECKWRVDDIIPGYAVSSFDLLFYDIAMNELKVTEEIEIYGVAEQSPNFWSFDIEHQMPSAIDRSTSEIINQIMAYHLQMRSSQEAELLESSLVGCEGDTAYLESTGKDLMVNNGEDSMDPYMIFTFKRFDSRDLDALDINCTFETKSVYNKVVYPPEYDTVNFHIPLFNSPLGEASDATKEKIEGLKDTYIRGWWRFIGGLNTFFRYARGACMIVSSFRQAVSVFHSVELAFGKTQQASTAVGNIPGAAAANTKRVLACHTTENMKQAADQGWQNTFNKLCGFVNCKLGPMPPEKEDVKTPLMSKLSILGGRARLCGPITDALGGDAIQKWTGKTEFGDFDSEDFNRYNNPSGYMNVRDSMVLSICSLCLPGIIYNLQKYRQIQCMYIDCLETSMETGVPADACDGVKDYATCKYVLGEIFQFIPVTAFLQHYLDKVRTAISDPFSILGLGFGIGCRQFCNAPDDAVLGGSGHAVCMGAKIVADIGLIAGNVKAIFDSNTWSPSGDYCKKLADEDEEKEDKESDEEEQEDSDEEK